MSPSYFRHKYDGTITSSIVYPLMRALYGKRIRQPIGSDCGFSGRLVSVLSGGGCLAHQRGALRDRDLDGHSGRLPATSRSASHFSAPKYTTAWNQPRT